MNTEQAVYRTPTITVLLIFIHSDYVQQGRCTLSCTKETDRVYNCKVLSYFNDYAANCRKDPKQVHKVKIA